MCVYVCVCIDCIEWYEDTHSPCHTHSIEYYSVCKVCVCVCVCVCLITCVVD
jgi:hypothetical protein